MAITKKQMELDKIKWEKSEQEGKDACGSFDFCVKCDKQKENPCDKAFTAYNKKPVVKTTAKKVSAAKPANAEVAAAKAKPAKTKKK